MGTSRFGTGFGVAFGRGGVRLRAGIDTKPEHVRAKLERVLPPGAIESLLAEGGGIVTGSSVSVRSEVVTEHGIETTMHWVSVNGGPELECRSLEELPESARALVGGGAGGGALASAAAPPAAGRGAPVATQDWRDPFSRDQRGSSWRGLLAIAVLLAMAAGVLAVWLVLGGGGSPV